MLKEETNWLLAHLELNLWRLNGLQVDKLKLHGFLTEHVLAGIKSIPTSYPRLIKALREALPDKLLTLVTRIVYWRLFHVLAYAKVHGGNIMNWEIIVIIVWD